jgi:hypothetical protein
MAQAPEVQVVGLRALMRDLARAANPDAGALLDAMKKAGRTAVEPVAAAVQSTVPKASGALSGSVRVSATRTGAAVRMGRASVPYAGPVDFGGWPDDREYIAGGRYLFPAAEGLAPKSAQLYNDGMQRALDSFNWTNTTSDGAAVHD